MRFTKMQGVGNDFVVLDSRELPMGTDLPALALWACRRGFGIGADGLLVVGGRTPDAEITMRMFNPDGSEDVCGNGLRCVSLWARNNGLIPVGQSEFSVRVLQGARRVRMLRIAPDGREGDIQVDMGVPRLQPRRIPISVAERAHIVNVPLPVSDRDFPIISVNTGSTHTVIFVDALSEQDFQTYSPLIERHPWFPERTSVLWATAKADNDYSVRIWERGAGETLGCGTGACAVAVAAVLDGRAHAHKPIAVRSRGGALTIRWPSIGSSMSMSGPAATVYEGDFSYHVPA